MPSIKLLYRDVKKSNDPSIPFVGNSWIKSYGDWAIDLEFEGDRTKYGQFIVPMVKRLRKQHRLVVAEIDIDCYVGWICGKKGELDYVYVKSLYRRDGIASELISRVCGTMGVYRFGSRNYGFIKSLEENFIFKPLERNTNEHQKSEQDRTERSEQVSTGESTTPTSATSATGECGDGITTDSV